VPVLSCQLCTHSCLAAFACAARDAFSNAAECTPSIAALFTGTMEAAGVGVLLPTVACAESLVALTFMPTIASAAYAIAVELVAGSARRERLIGYPQRRRIRTREGGVQRANGHLHALPFTPR